VGPEGRKTAIHAKKKFNEEKRNKSRLHLANEVAGSSAALLLQPRKTLKEPGTEKRVKGGIQWSQPERTKPGTGRNLPQEQKGFKEGCKVPLAKRGEGEGRERRKKAKTLVTWGSRGRKPLVGHQKDLLGHTKNGRGPLTGRAN